MLPLTRAISYVRAVSSHCTTIVVCNALKIIVSTDSKKARPYLSRVLIQP